jgi:hypothetical protein
MEKIVREYVRRTINQLKSEITAREEQKLRTDRLCCKEEAD